MALVKRERLKQATINKSQSGLWGMISKVTSGSGSSESILKFIKGLLIVFHGIVQNLSLFTGKSKLAVYKNCHTSTLFIGADLELRLGTYAKFSLVYRYLHV